MYGSEQHVIESPQCILYAEGVFAKIQFFYLLSIFHIAETYLNVLRIDFQ